MSFLLVLTLSGCRSADRIACVDDDPATGAATWYRDADADRSGDERSATTACEQPAGYVEDATDCDDGDPSVSPAAPESCNGVDDDCDGTVDEGGANAPTWYADLDGDGYGDVANPSTGCVVGAGYVDNATDCDDDDADVSPDGTERCDTRDNDCDGEVDEDSSADALTWYGDDDGDSYGDPTKEQLACAAPVGTVADLSDCDDESATVHPGAEESCNATDDDCDGEIDEDGIDPATWYLDADGDGFGRAALTALGCDAPEGYVGDATDCDDLDPGAAPDVAETCDDKDDDCDGQVDEDDAVGAPTWYADDDGDGYGDAAAPYAACAAPAGHVADLTDCDDGDSGVSPAGTERCNTADDDCDGDTDEDDAVDAPTWYEDTDLDGYGDPLAGAPSCTAPAGSLADDADCDDTDAAINPAASEVCGDVVDDDCDGVPDDGCAPSGALGVADAWLVLYGEAPGDAAGSAVVSVEDIDGDGLGEVLVGAPYSDQAAVDAGSGYLLTALSPSSTLGSATLEVVGLAADDTLGAAVAGGGDLDADGVPDLVLGAPYGAGGSTSLVCHYPSGSVSSTGSGSADGGAAYAISGASTGTLSAASNLALLYAEAADDLAGQAVSGGEDFTGDGIADLLISAPATADFEWCCQEHLRSCTGDGGTMHVVSGAALATGVLWDAELTIVGNSSDWDGGTTGTSAAFVGDVDGDGLSDAAGVRSSSTTAFVVFGGTSGTVQLEHGDEDIALGAAGGTSGTTRVARAGDVDGDGLEDLLMGASASLTATDEAAAWLVEGLRAGSFTLAAEADLVLTSAGSNQPDVRCAGQGDVDADGNVDLLLGSPGSADAAGGRAWLFYAPGVGSLALSSADATFSGTAANDALGTALAMDRDLNGDGAADLLFGVPGDDTAGTDAGAVWVFLGGR